MSETEKKSAVPNEIPCEVPCVNMEIDGIAVKAPQGSMIIEVADNTEGVVIPRFCYHKKLSVAANCRMCLVELEGGRKPMPACATPVSEGMKVYTKSPKTMQYQKTIMEFLLVNHPLDCPVCDQGGECELQDIAMGYGKDVSRYHLAKRSVPEKNIGPLVATELTRCIHCTRCVRFGQEIAGLQELGMTGRGEHSEISSFLEGAVNSEMSGNMIDLCPVGALTAKPSRFSARPWELQQQPGIGFHDCVGSNLYGHIRRGKLMRVVPRENEIINEVWLSDRDRFSYEGLNVDNRAVSPLIKNSKGDWGNTAWEDALEHVVKVCHEQCKTHGPETMAALLSPSSTVEEGYLLQKLFRQIGSDSIDYRLRQQDFKADPFMSFLPGIDCSIEEIASFDATLLIGSNVRYEQPIIHHRIRNAVRDEGACVMSINPQRFNFRFRHHDSWVVNHHEMPDALAQTLKAVLELKAGVNGSCDVLKLKGLDAILAGVIVTESARKIAQNLFKAKKPVIFLGGVALRHPQYSLLVSLSKTLANLVGAKGGLLTAGANSRGLAQAGCLPHRLPGFRTASKVGSHAKAVLTGESGSTVVFLLNLDPALDTGFGSEALEVLSRAKLVVALTPYLTDSIRQVADVILPIAASPETSGTFVNASGEWQSFAAMSNAPGEARPAWKVLRVLGNLFKQEGFDYVSSEDVLAEVKTYNVAELNLDMNAHFVRELDLTQVAPMPIKTGLARMNLVPLYGVDMVVRHAKALSETVQMKDLDKIIISPALAQLKNLNHGELARVTVGSVSVELPVLIEPTLADQTVSIFQSRLATLPLGNLCEGLTLEKAQKAGEPK